MCSCKQNVRRLLVNSRLSLSSVSLITNTWSGGGSRKLPCPQNCFSVPATSAGPVLQRRPDKCLQMRHKVEFLRDPTLSFFPPYPPFVSPLLTPCRREVWKNVLFVRNFSFYSLYCAIVSLGRLYFSSPLTLKFAIWLARAKGKWAQVIINEFCAEILKGIANFCQVLLVFLSSAMRSAYPRKLLTAKWDTYEQTSVWFTALSRAAISDPQTHE